MLGMLTVAAWTSVIVGLVARLVGRAIQRAAVPGPSEMAPAWVAYRAMLKHHFLDGAHETGTYRQGGTIVTDDEGRGEYLYYQLTVAGLPVFTNDNEFVLETDDGRVVPVETTGSATVLEPRARGYLPLGWFEVFGLARRLFAEVRRDGADGFDAVAYIRRFYEERRHRVTTPGRGLRRFWSRGVFVVERAIRAGDPGLVRLDGSTAVLAVATGNDLDSPAVARYYVGMLVEQFGSTVMWSGLIALLLS